MGSRITHNGPLATSCLLDPNLPASAKTGSYPLRYYLIRICHGLFSHYTIPTVVEILIGTPCRNRTGTSKGKQILSLQRLPIPPRELVHIHKSSYNKVYFRCLLVSSEKIFQKIIFLNIIFCPLWLRIPALLWVV